MQMSHRANWSPADKARMQRRLHPPTRHAVSELAVIIDVNSKHTWLKPIRASWTTSWKSVFLSRLVLCRKMTTAALKQGDKDTRSIRLMCAHTRKCFTWRTWFTFRAREFSETSFCSLPAALSSPRHKLSWSYETRCCSRSILDVTEGFLCFHREKEFVRGQGVFFHVGS